VNGRFSLASSLPLAASIAGHGSAVVLLILFAGRVAPIVPPPEPKPAIEIMLAPPPPAVEEPPPPPPVVKTEPPPQPPPVVETKPPPPPRPRSRPAVVRRPPPPVREPPAEPRPVLPPPVQTAAMPRPPVEPPRPAAPVVSAAYRGALGAWLESHKQYPEGARERGEAGQAVLRFQVARSGRVVSYTIVKSTGYPDLDAAIGRMMQGASLPPFPADMSAADIDVSVAIRFALAR
jgi:periplasmic protein TonB